MGQLRIDDIRGLLDEREKDMIFELVMMADFAMTDQIMNEAFTRLMSRDSLYSYVRHMFEKFKRLDEIAKELIPDKMFFSSFEGAVTAMDMLTSDNVGNQQKKDNARYVMDKLREEGLCEI